MRTLAKRLSRVGVVGIVSLLLLSAMARFVSANLIGSDRNGSASVSEPAPPALDELELLIRQIAEREEQLDRQDAELAARAAELAEAEEMIARSIAELVEAQEALEARMFESNSASEDDLVSLTAIYEGMKPKDAAALFETMDPDFAAGFLARMAPDAAAAVFSNLTPLTAYAVSAYIAGRNTNAVTERDQ